MEPLWKLLYMLEPAHVTLVLTTVVVTFDSTFQALNYGKEMEQNLDLSETSITLDRSQALMIPIMSSCSLLLMFHLFFYVSQLFTAFTVVASTSSLFFCLSPYVMYLKLQLGLLDPFVSRCWSKSFTHIQGLLLLLCSGIVAAWLVSGHWILNNLLGISICIAFVSHVFFFEIFFGANVMVLVAAQQASNFVRIVANNLSLPRLQLITNKLKLSMKIVFSKNLFGGVVLSVILQIL
ncbi:hypothetical protein VitviT2T_008406 [Vitis vinifera]|uniref:Uncharacterized protein n=1 Tax=Vitis vinifera TaxID=29760 RepID=A0ABY9C370_VITVI|nr:hypothetical protein VitviT2T_008406 [Vitis vinifera]